MVTIGKGKQIVRHRIDGLEIEHGVDLQDGSVRHRIDGLETMVTIGKGKQIVRHRIDGLEKCQIF